MNGLNYKINYGIETFNIEIRQNDSTVQSFTNQGFRLSKQNEQTLHAYDDDGYILINNVNASFSCGVKVPFRESKPIFYE
jgi:hypothetical protein